MHAFFRERVEINGQGGHQGFAFAGFHFGDFPFMQHHAADDLHIEVPHLQDTPTRLPHHGKGFGQDVIECGALLDLFPELGCFCFQRVIAEFFYSLLQNVDFPHVFLDAFDFPVVFSADDFLN